MALFGGGNDIRVRFLADTSQVGAATRDMGSGISQGLGMAGLGWAAAGAAAVAFGKQSIDAALASEEAQARLAEQYRKFPELHDKSLSSLNALADATLKKTRYDDEAARAAIGLLAQYSLTGSQIEELLPLVTDFAAKTGKELPDAASAIGKALLGNTRALKEVGINYKLTGDEATDYANIVQLLHEKVGGAAAADADTTAGKLAMLGNQYGELKEQVGLALLPIIQYLAPALIAVLQVLAMSFQGWGLMIQWVIDHATGLGQILLFLVSPLTWLITQTDVVSTAFRFFGAVIQTVAGWLVGVFAGAVNFVTGALSAVWGVISDVAGAIGGFFVGAWNAAMGAINGVARAIAWVIDKLNALKGVWNAVSGVISKIGGIVGLSAPVPAYGYAGAPTLALAGTGRSRALSGAGGIGGGGAGLVVKVEVHGNVGDPALIGRRTVEALNTYVRTNGARALRHELGLA